MKFLCIENKKYLDVSKFYRKVKKRCEVCSNKKFKCELSGKFFYKKLVDNSH